MSYDSAMLLPRKLPRKRVSLNAGVPDVSRNDQLAAHVARASDRETTTRTGPDWPPAALAPSELKPQYH